MNRITNPKPELFYISSYVVQELHALLKENHERLKHDFETKADDFYEASNEVRCIIGQIKILTIANGGDATASAFAKCADKLMAASNAFSRQVEIISRNPLANVNYTVIQDLATECQALRIAANDYATAKETARPAIQRRIADAVAKTDPLIAELRRPHQTNNENLRLVAQMLIARREKGMDFKKAIRDIAHSDPSIHQQFFSGKGSESYARKLVHLHKRGEL